MTTETAQPQISKKAMTGLVIGVVSVLLSFLLAGAGFLPSLVGLALSWAAYGNIRDGLRTGRSIAIAGLWTNAVALLIGTIYLIVNLTAI